MDTEPDATFPWDSPLEPVARLLESEQIEFETGPDHIIRFQLQGNWANYPVWFRWMPEPNMLQVGLGLDLPVTRETAAQASQLLTQVNEQLLLGHFDLWSEDLAVTFRHGQLLSGAGAPTDTLIEQMLAAAMEGAEFLYPALQVLGTAQTGANEAMQMALMETAGEA